MLLFFIKEKIFQNHNKCPNFVVIILLSFPSLKTVLCNPTVGDPVCAHTGSCKPLLSGWVPILAQDKVGGAEYSSSCHTFIIWNYRGSIIHNKKLYELTGTLDQWWILNFRQQNYFLICLHYVPRMRIRIGMHATRKKEEKCNISRNICWWGGLKVMYRWHFIDIWLSLHPLHQQIFIEFSIFNR